MTLLTDLLANRNEQVPLDVAALELASIEFPGLAIQPSVEILDSHVRELGEMVSGAIDGEEYVRVANHYFFGQLGFRGNELDYYAPANRCLNHVLVARTGIPITLALVYVEVGRRLGQPVSGIGLPGHFLVRYQDEDFGTFIDPFHGGRLMTEDDCRALALQLTGLDIATDASALQPVSKWKMAVRMLYNLRAIYARRKEYGKLARVLDLILAATPDARQDRELRDQLRRYLGMMN